METRALAQQKAAQEHAEQSKRTTWGAYFWGAAATSESSDDEMSEEQKQQQLELFKAIDYDEGTASEDLSDESLKLRITAGLKKWSFALRTKSEAEATADAEILSVVLDKAEATMFSSAATLETTFGLGSFGVYDGTSSGSLHPKIIRVKDEITPTMPPPDNRTTDATTDVIDNHVLFIKFRQNPPDGYADSSAIVRMKAVEMVYHRGYVEAVFAFFRPPDDTMQSVSALLVSKRMMAIQSRGLIVIYHIVDCH